ncbi:MAG: acetyl-CoA C-acyltransferase [Candidatus Hermodarchaeota archaeon]
MKIRDVYITDYVRTPFSRSRPREPPRDVFGNLRPDEMTALTLTEMFDNRLKGKVKPEDVDEFYIGATHFNNEYVTFGGRYPIFLAKFPSKVSSVALDRACGSGMTAASVAYDNIALGYSDVVIASGKNNATMSRSRPPTVRDPNPAMLKGHEFYVDDTVDFRCSYSMLQTAQKLHEVNANIFSKEDNDRFSVRSHQLAAKAQEEGFFKGEIVPIMAHAEGDVDTPLLIEHDTSVRKNATYEGTKDLRGLTTPGWAGGYYNPLLTKEEYIEIFGTDQGLVTAGNSCPTNAGAATLLLMSEDAMKKYDLDPIARVVSIGFGAVDPTVMGRGPVPASWMALKHAGLTTDDIDYWEINEAFAIVALNWMHEMGLDDRMDDINIKGGGIAIGHPIAATGPRIAGTLARILKEKKAKYGLATMCCGGGQGTAMIVENTDV